MSLNMAAYAVWAGTGAREAAWRRFPGPAVPGLEEIPHSAPGLVVLGGGRMMDEAKYFRARRRPQMGLVLVPSLWGSGAERSPIVVLNRDGAKYIETDTAFLPDAVIYWPELLRTISEERARHACGDVWSHVLEAFLSPLGTEELYGELAALMQQLLRLPLATDERWFEASACACELQSKASVGLIHGIAHVLELQIIAQYPESGWGHAKLCSVLLQPVMELNRRNSGKWVERAAQYGIDDEAVSALWGPLHEAEAYRQVLPLLKQNWPQILRDRCSRTNGTLIRPQAIQFFEEWQA